MLLLILAISFIILWVLFLAYTALYSKWVTLKLEVKIAGCFVVLIGFFIDVLINWTIGLLLGVTKDVTLSQKCSRLKKTVGWRAEVAKYLCSTWLDPFEVGGHCK